MVFLKKTFLLKKTNVFFLLCITAWNECMGTIWLDWVLMVEVSRERVQFRPKLGWMDGVKMALGCKMMTVEAVR